MRVLLEFTTEELKANKGKTLDELFNAKGTAKLPGKKKPVKEDEEEETEDEEEETEDEEEETEDEESDEVDDDMIKALLSKLAKAGKDAKIKAVFAKYKCKTISGLKTNKYTDFYNDLKKIK